MEAYSGYKPMDSTLCRSTSARVRILILCIGKWCLSVDGINTSVGLNINDSVVGVRPIIL